ncbi:hypothetical protein [Clostridium taeniosporum]|uniref:Uncharacterized protein n=1 Tax=Clostridium taeniosporum TaxID=394958 RepID=A0A1D7XNW0_9CLOT|nr:hypothetical protein [Clostridium taeniosporum]AOR25018.1 hypothetical protein BGI42_14825 [Clostridium taeniosporum]
MKLKFLSLFLASSMCFTALTSTAFAADIKSSNSFVKELQSQLENNETSCDYLNQMNENIEKSNISTHNNRRKRSLGNPFNMIIRATQTMKTEQLKMNKILNEINMKKQYQTVSTITTQKPKLTVFGVYSYIEHGTVHKDYNETIHRSNLPLSILTYQEGYGEITGVSIDGVAIKSALVAKGQIDENQPIDDVCAQVITLDESLISNLSDGSHSIEVSCTGKNKNITDNLTFILAD